jgi:predicted DNA-binding protein (UPF0278 family)
MVPGELNGDVLDHDAAVKLSKWFEERWNDRWCVNITAELIQAIEERRTRINKRQEGSKSDLNSI